MTRTDIYTLDSFQYESMLRLANEEKQLLMILDELEGDGEPVKKRLAEHRKAVEDLVALGLVEDKSEQFLEVIAGAQVRLGRGFKVYLITTTGFDMFNGPERAKN